MLTVVTGSAGFIGRALVRALASRGEVIGIDRLAQQATPGVTALSADLLAGDPRVRSALARADTVFHLAGCPDVRDPRRDADEHRYRDNVLATAAVLAAVPPASRLLVTSSSSVYGGTSPGRPSGESDPLRPRGGYARSKFLVEQLCTAREQAGGRITVVRPFTVAGEGQRPGMALALWIAAARDGRPLRLIGSPRRSRDITDVRDVVQALVDLAGTEAAGVVNLGSGVGRSLAELASVVSRVVGVEVHTEVVPAAGVEVRHTLADTRRLRRLVGWVPETDLDALLSRQLAAAGCSELPGERHAVR